DADYRARMEAAALQMPSYRKFLSARQVDDLVAYLRATSGQILPEGDAAAGAHGGELAAEYGRLRCHRAPGAGGVSNPGSFKGYIPALWGADYDELVHDDEELRRWIADGSIPRITEHPIGGWFFRRQAAKMPAYGKFLAADDVAALAAYV